MKKTVISCATAFVAVAFALVFGQDDDDDNLFKPFEFGCSKSTKLLQFYWIKEDVQDALENAADVLYGDTIQKNQLCPMPRVAPLSDVLKGDSAAGALPVLDGAALQADAAGRVAIEARACQAAMVPFVVRNFPRAEALLAWPFKDWSMCDADPELCLAEGAQYFHHGHLFPHGKREHEVMAPEFEFRRVPNVSLGAWLAEMRDDRRNDSGLRRHWMSEPPVKTQRRQLLPMRAAQHLRRSSNVSSLRNQLQAALTPIPDQLSGRGRAKSGVSFRLGRGAYETTFHVDYSSNWILDSGKKSVIIAPPEEMAALAISDGSNPASRTLVRQSPFILHQLRRRVRAGEPLPRELDSVSVLQHHFRPADLVYIPFSWPHLLETTDQQDESQEWMTLSRFHTEVADRIEDLGLHGAHVACTA